MIIPVHKKRPTTVCSNYRPISITCVTSKIQERIIANQIKDHFLSNNLLHEAQHGFLTSRSTCTNLLESLNDWTLYLQDKHGVVIAYVDFSKAFDVVSHNKLFVRLVIWYQWYCANMVTQFFHRPCSLYQGRWIAI